MTGFLHAPEDLDGMAASAVRLLQDPALHSQVAQAARQHVNHSFCVDRVVPMYEEYDRRVRG